MNAPKTVSELRAEIARGCEAAAKVWQKAADEGLHGAAAGAAKLRADAVRNRELARRSAAQ